MVRFDYVTSFPSTDGRRAKPLIDENTIGVCPILGSTFNGEYEDVKGACVWPIDRSMAVFWLIFLSRWGFER